MCKYILPNNRDYLAKQGKRNGYLNGKLYVSYVFYRAPRVRRLYNDGATSRLCVKKKGGEVLAMTLPKKIPGL